MLAPEPFFEPRGTPISVYLRLEMLSRLGHTVCLLTYHLGEDVSIPGVSLVRIPSVPFIKQVKVGPSWIKPILDGMLFIVAIKLLLQQRFHVIHSHEEAAFFGAVLAKLFRKPHVYDMHSSLPHQLKNFRYGDWWLLIRLFELLERWVLRTSQAVITVGADLEQHVKQINPEARLVCVENVTIDGSVEPAIRKLAGALRSRLRLNERVCIVYTGTFEHYQGLDLLFESIKIVVQHVPSALFLLVGGRPDQVQHWQHKVEAEHLQEHVRLIGTVPLTTSQAYLEVADILVSPRLEGTSIPLKIYAYLQSGKPIVATRLSAHTQVLSEATTVLVEPSQEALAAGILKLAGEPELRRRLGLQAKALALQKYSVAEQLAKLEWVYRSVGPVTAGPSAGPIA